MNKDFSPLHSPVPSASLIAIMQAIASSLDVSRIFTIVAQQLAHILSHDAMAVLLRPTPRDAVGAGDIGDLALTYCSPPIAETGRSWSATDFSFGPVLLANQPVAVPDFAATAAQHAGDTLLQQLGRAGLIVPIAAPQVLGGLVLVSGTIGVYRAEDAHLIEPIACLLAVALEHQRLDEQARALTLVEERNRMAREFHDTVAQSLTGIILNLEALKPYQPKLSEMNAGMLVDTEALARGALEEARRSVLGLHPTSLQHHSLRDALTVELAGLAKRTALMTQIYVHGAERPLQPDQATALFRIAQEAFQNIHKHAAARHVMLGLVFEEAAVVLTVEDDGLGFVPGAADSAPANPDGGFGLLSMAARARSLGGELLVTSQPGHGTTVRATIPYTRSDRERAAGTLIKSPAVAPGEASPGHMAGGSSTTHPIRVLLVDDHAIVRRGMRHVLEDQPDITVVGEAEDGLGALEQAEWVQADVVLLDLQLPGLSGIDVLTRLRAGQPSVEVVILTVFDQDEEVFACLKAGARGYLLKDAAPAALTAAVRAAARGHSSLTPRLATPVMERFAVLAGREVDPDALTERELEILGFMSQGLPYKQIGTQLHISAKTVNYHAAHILRKLQVRSRGEAVAVARERGLLNRSQ
jgi:DNA-binding NarL/FixJ family response regulator/signal transduction histidine kinase